MDRRHVLGFTLIELMVVVAIIAALIAILLPNMTQARELSRRVVCASQVRQTFMAAASFADNAKGRYPVLDSEPILAPAFNWHMPNFTYNRPLRKDLLRLSQQIELCPSNPDREWHHVNGYQPGIDYAGAYALWFGRSWSQYDLQVGDHVPGLLMNDAKSTDIFAGDLVRQWAGGWTRPMTGLPSIYSGDPLRINNHLAGDGRPAGGNIAWADGSARWLNWSAFNTNIYYKNLHTAAKGQDWDFYLGVSR